MFVDAGEIGEDFDKHALLPFGILHIPSAGDDGFRLPIIHLLHSLVNLCLGVASPLYKLGTVISFNRV